MTQLNSIRDRLSKSSYIRGLQCEKSLYLSRYRPELREEPGADRVQIFTQGTNIGLLARQLFPGGVAADEKPDGIDQVEYTRQLIDAGHSVIYEAAFSHNGVYCAVDILVRDGHEWEVFEVKSSLGVRETHFIDAAVQYYVLSGAGLRLEDVCIVHLNARYVRGETIDVEQLFSFTAVLEECVTRQEEIGENVARLRAVLREPNPPVVKIGEHCDTPYECDFKSHCWKDIPEVSIFSLPRLKSQRRFELYDSGVVRIEDIPEDFPLGKAEIAAQAHRTGETHVDVEGIRGFISTLTEPVCYMDFETVFPAVPWFKGTRPYQQIPFQFCFGRIEHGFAYWTDFVASTGYDPRGAFIENLLAAAEESEGSILVYNKAFEIARLLELARLFPSERRWLFAVIRRIRDLLDVFRSGFFYDPRMMGSNSIKSVLPVFAPEMSYAMLEIQDGGSASAAYEALGKARRSDEEKAIRKALIRYCRNDTEGMHRILEGLKRLAIEKGQGE